MITTPPAVMTACTDPRVTGTTRQMYDWCIVHLELYDFRPIKRSALKERMAQKITMLVAMGYLKERKRPNGGDSEYALAWSLPQQHAA